MSRIINKLIRKISGSELAQKQNASIIKKDRKEICFISSFSVICVWDEPAIKIVNLNI